MPKIGRYEVKAEIGRGAMGVVYLAHDPRLRRRVAVKTYYLPDGLSKEQVREFQQRFLREAQAAAGLSHPGIVTIYDADEDRSLGLPFIAMEYVPGKSLRQLLEMGDRLEPQWVFKMGSVLADALQVAHEAGIIHRDIKPANILLRGPDGAAKIADFGVARLATSELTQTGASLGSPAYMSPEQIRGGTVDGRSDLFSLAIILYEALCGKRPFTGEDLPSLVYSIAHDVAIPITRRVKGLPSGLDTFFQRALAKDPSDRYPDGVAFRRVLEEARDSELADRVGDAMAPLALQEALSPPDGRTSGEDASCAPPIRRPAKTKRGGRLLELKFGIAALLSVLLIVFLYFWYGRPAHLKLDARSSVEAGRLALMVDGEQVYSRHLAVPNGGRGVFNKLLGKDHETFEGWIKVRPGKHEVVAEVFTDGVASEYRDSIVVDLKAGETRTLRMVAGRSFGTPVSLKAD